MLRVRIVSTAAELAECHTLRRLVFVAEQGVPPHEEWDDRDAICTHFLALDEGDAVGTARLFVVDGAQGKAQRVAVKKSDRGRGIGRALMKALEQEARQRHLSEIVLGAQLGALPFYARLGYSAYGPEFDDAGIPHRMMRKRLLPPEDPLRANVDAARGRLPADSPPTIAIRRALISELSRIVEIDDDATTLYAEAGLDLTHLVSTHPFVLAEQSSWEHSLRQGQLFCAALPSDELAGFISLSHVDARPYVEQLSVRRIWMRRGIGSRLLQHAIGWARSAGELWLTTYSHLPWNRAYYERSGFRVAPPPGPALAAILAAERAALPAPEQRVAMVYRAPA